MTDNVVDYNLYFAPGGGTNGTWIWKNVTYTTFAAYQSGSGNDANGLVGSDPLLVSTTNTRFTSSIYFSCDRSRSESC